MCGISAIADFGKPDPKSRARIERMNEALRHRGPDGVGTFVSEDGVALGSTRLSIVGGESGAMPIVRKHEGHAFAIVSNGEFFNYRELRRELEKKYRFETRSDTEVALVAYLEWGERCVERLRGQFAFAVYDGARRRLFFARDRFGIKPLYYARSGGALILASEPRGILESGLIAPKPDAYAAAAFFLGALAMGKSEPLDRSLFEGIRALPPSTRAVFESGALRIEAYDRLPFPKERGGSLEEHAAALRRELTRATREQVPDEVPWGVLLSGGLDSSILLTIAREGGAMPVAAASVRYRGQENSDYEHAQIVAKRLGVPLIAPELSGEELLAGLDDLVAALGRPADSPRNLALLPAYRSLARRGAKVALIGEGADEFNLGYYYTLPGFFVGKEECATAEGFRALLSTRAGAAARYFNPDFADEALVGQVIEDQTSAWYEEADIEDPLDRMQHFYARQFLKGRLDTHDRAAMASGVEARVPFCDEGVVAAALAVPHAHNLMGGSEKVALREAFRGALPERILARRKSPLPESTAAASHRALLDAFDRAFAEADPSVWDVLNKDHARKLREEAQGQIAAIERGEGKSLGDGAKLTDPLDFRIRHLFLPLTFMRWHRLHIS